MRIRSNARRIANYFIHNRGELLTIEFWRTIARVVRSRGRIWDRVGREEFESALRKLEQRPWNLHVEVTNTCNANCVFCAYQHQTRKKGVMPMELYRSVLDEYCSMGGGELELDVCVGEPLVDPGFIEKVELARARPEISHIATISNGILLHKHGVERVLNSGLNALSISVGLFDREGYEAIYRNKHYALMRENVLALLKRNQELGEPVKIKLMFRSNLGVTQTLALPDYQEIRKYPHGVEFNVDFDTWSGEITAEDLLPGMQIRPLSTLESEPCFWFYDGPIVYVDGSVGACGCRDFNANSELIIGNLRDGKLIDIWRGEPMRLLRERFRRAEYPEICKKCSTYTNLGFYRTRPGCARADEVAKRLTVIQ